jgi:HEAT repeat protein
VRELKLWNERDTARMISTLRDIGPAAKPAVAELMAALRDERHARWRRSLIEAIGNIDPSAEGFLGLLVDAATDKDVRIVLSAVLALSRVDQDDDAKARALIGGMTHQNRDVRLASIRTLGSMGSKAAAAVPALTEAIADEDGSVRSAAESALKQIQGQPRDGTED